MRELSEQGALGGVSKFSITTNQKFSQSSAELANGLAFEDPRLTLRKSRPTVHLHVTRLKNRDRKIVCFPGHTDCQNHL